MVCVSPNGSQPIYAADTLRYGNIPNPEYQSACAVWVTDQQEFTLLAWLLRDQREGRDERVCTRWSAEDTVDVCTPSRISFPGKLAHMTQALPHLLTLFERVDWGAGGRCKGALCVPHVCISQETQGSFPV